MSDSRALAGHDVAGLARERVDKVIVESVTHSFISSDGSNPAIKDVSFSIGAGEFVAIVGPSGCGKSTLLNLVSGLMQPTLGRILIDGIEVEGVNVGEVGYMPARDALLPWRTAERNVELPLELRNHRRGRDHNQIALELLETVGLAGYEGYYPGQLSQGMRQRVAIARTFATKPNILLMDEPFSALDAQTKIDVQDTFLNLWEQEQRTVLLITHDIFEAVALADRVIVFTGAPGTVMVIHEIDLPRPRSVQQLLFEEPAFQHYLREIWANLQHPRDEGSERP